MTLPLFLQSDGPTTTGDADGPGAGHPAELLRSLIDHIAGGSSGVIDAAGLAVTTPGGLDLDIAAGTAFLPTSSGGHYFAAMPAASLSLAAAHPSLDRIDLVALVVNDSEYSGARADDGIAVVVIEGTPAASPSAPSTALSHIPLAAVALPAAATTAGTITDARLFHTSSKGVPTFANVGDRAARWLAPPVGAVSTLADDGRLSWWNGTKWQTATTTQVSTLAPTGTPVLGELWAVVAPPA